MYSQGILVVMVLLLWPLFVNAATYTWGHTTNITQESILLASIYDACQAAIAAEKPPPTYCTANCSSCTPSNSEKEAYIFEKGPTVWFAARRREVRQARANEACTLYRGASDSLRAQVDALAGLPPLTTAGAGDTYAWTHTSNANQETVIGRSYQLECQALRSASQPLPPNCTPECVCTPTTGQKESHIFQAGFVDWFQRERARLRQQRLSQFCAAYPDLTHATQDQIDALLGLQTLP